MRTSLMVFVFLAMTTVMVQTKTFLIETEYDGYDGNDYQQDDKENATIFAPCILGSTTYQHGDKMPSIEGDCCKNCNCHNGTITMCKDVECLCEMEGGTKKLNVKPTKLYEGPEVEVLDNPEELDAAIEKQTKLYKGPEVEVVDYPKILDAAIEKALKKKKSKDNLKPDEAFEKLEDPDNIVDGNTAVVK